MTHTVRTRMAPSPTGEYHIGHIRTALYNIAFAKQHKGKFILRIEDTDRTRYVEGATDRILDVLEDYGLSWDEGPRKGGDFGPYTQSERLAIYKKYALELVEKKAAYYCFCTPERLSQMREEQRAKKLATTKYDKHCLSLSPEEIEKNLTDNLPHVIRLNVPANKIVGFTDVVFGEVKVNTNDIDDQVLLKSDGFPTYHLGVVIDDYLMKITHVMRGNDWIPSTPKHVLLYEAFGWEHPTYIHLPNLKELGASQKLSKRYGPVSAREFLDEGYLPEALLNFLMLLGWNPGTEQEIYTFDEFVKDFDLKKIHKTDLVSFDRQKLTWMNQQYIQMKSDEELKELIINFYPKAKDLSGETFNALIPLVKTRMKTLKEFEQLTKVFFAEKGSIENEEEKDIAKSLAHAFSSLSEWNHDMIFAEMRKIMEEKSIRMPVLYKIITGEERGLPLPQVLEILGKDRTRALLTF